MIILFSIIYNHKVKAEIVVSRLVFEDEKVKFNCKASE